MQTKTSRSEKPVAVWGVEEVGDVDRRIDKELHGTRVGGDVRSTFVVWMTCVEKVASRMWGSYRNTNISR
jgi:hypothetical protein